MPTITQIRKIIDVALMRVNYNYHALGDAEKQQYLDNLPKQDWQKILDVALKKISRNSSLPSAGGVQSFALSQWDEDKLVDILASELKGFGENRFVWIDFENGENVRDYPTFHDYDHIVLSLDTGVDWLDDDDDDYVGWMNDKMGQVVVGDEPVDVFCSMAVHRIESEVAAFGKKQINDIGFMPALGTNVSFKVQRARFERYRAYLEDMFETYYMTERFYQYCKDWEDQKQGIAFVTEREDDGYKQFQWVFSDTSALTKVTFETPVDDVNAIRATSVDPLNKYILQEKERCRDWIESKRVGMLKELHSDIPRLLPTTKPAPIFR